MEKLFINQRGINLRDKQVLLVGFGAITGPAAVKALFTAGARVMVTDLKSKKELGSSFKEVEKLPIHWELGRHPKYLLDEADLIVVSPGVPMTVPILQEAKERFIPVISEIELAYHLCKPRMIAITGTNGKTTTTALTGELISHLLVPTAVGGNIGNPLVEVAADLPPEGWVSVEVSSFQLEGIIYFRPRISVILNLTPDHLDRHGTFEEYLRAKKRIFMNQTPEDILILNRDDKNTFSIAGEARARTLFFSTTEKVNGIWVEDDLIYTNCYGGPGNLSTGEKMPLISVKDIKLPGKHNLENVLAALLCARLAGVKKEEMREAIRNFRGIEHRIEFVAEIEGVRFYNDSKGTNPVSTKKALEAFTSPLILIAGGQDRGADFSDIAELIKDKVRHLFLLGETRDKIAREVLNCGFNHNNLTMVDSIEEAVEKAFKKAKSQDVVLLSPACPSWDMFPSYKVRGRVFKEAVKKLGG